MNLLHTAPLRASVALALLFNPVAHAQTELLGDWWGPQSLDVYVDASSTGGNGSLNNPFTSVTRALDALEAAGVLGAQDVTINLMGTTDFDERVEVFPIEIPSHGVSIEAHYVGSALPRVGPSLGRVAPSVIEVDSVGNPSLSPSVVRGLFLWNGFDNVNPNSVIRVEVPASGTTQRIAPEFRDCVVDGEPYYGVELIGAAGIQNETLFERNVIEQVDIAFGRVGVRIQGVGGGVMAPLFRANEIFNYQVNVEVDGGAASNQSRLQSNVIRDGGTNVRVGNASPWILSNTIAAANATGELLGAGIVWTGPGPIGFMNNLLWNPAGPDVVGSLAIFDNQPFERWAINNWDQDDRLYSALGMPGVLTPDPIPAASPFVDYAQRDLHLLPDSWFDGRGYEAYLGPLMVVEVPGLGQPTPIRLDLAWDMDFEGRLQGEWRNGGRLTVGADEVSVETEPGVTLSLAFDPLAANPADALGNLRPDVAGNWSTAVVVQGNPDFQYSLFAGTSFAAAVEWNGPGATVEERSAYHHSMLRSGQENLGSFGIPLESLFQTPFQQFTGAEERIPINFLPFDPALVEGEIFLQVLAIDNSGGFQVVHSSERLVLELNR